MGFHGCLIMLKVVLLVLIVQSSGSKDGLEVKTPYGTYIGHVIKSRGGRDLLSFKGVPYAEPPVGPLRFMEPVRLGEKEGIFIANEEKECVQAGMGLGLEEQKQNNSKYIGKEDCLYLNIYRPKDVPMDKLLPVYFWIHGGAYFGGSGTEAWNGPRLILDEKRDMVMVAINYRLGVLGFLSANDVNLPGNLGLKDQAMALKWVNENIKLFGGDPNSITIGGLSAGGASVSQHLNSKASRGLFHRAISQSGTADCSWARKSTEESRKIASNLIASLGCPSEPKELLRCLQELHVDTIMDSQEALKVKKTSMIMYLVPVIEKDSPTAFMTEESIAEGSKVPWLTGVTSEEGLLFYQFLGLEDPTYFDLSIMKENYKNIFPIVAYYSHSSNADEISEELKNFYFGDKDFGPETAKDFVQLLSDRMFNHGLLVSARKHKGKVFIYKLSYKGKNTLAVLRPNGLESGVSHGDDIVYFFNAQFGGIIEVKDKDLDLSNTLLEMWYNFIKKGDPTPDNHLWEESDGGKKYLDFTNDGPIMSSNMFQQRMEFLDKLEKKWKRHDEL